jgi:hypothetical protein
MTIAGGQKPVCGVDTAVAGVKLVACMRESLMKFFITAHDTAGSVTLQRDTVPAAIKKADELLSDGCWNVEIVTPDGAAYHPAEFDRLKERVGLSLGA